MATPQSASELAQQYLDHVDFLRASAAAYDLGKSSEAKRLAVSLRVLFHETPQSHSLLGQLGARGGTLFSTPDPYSPGNLISECPMIQMGFGSGGALTLPLLDDFPPEFRWTRLAFDPWWEGNRIIRISAGTFSRKELVCTVANKDGGAHVDPSLNDKYAQLSRRSGLGWEFVSEGEPAGEPLLEVERACVRQISHEVLKTFEADFIVLDESTGPVFARRPGQSQSCPCGSGRQFRKCHGRT